MAPSSLLLPFTTTTRQSLSPDALSSYPSLYLTTTLISVAPYQTAEAAKPIPTPTPHSDSVTLFGHNVPIWAIVVAATGLFIIIVVPFVYLILRCRRKRKETIPNRPVSMESFVAGTPDSIEPDTLEEPFVIISSRKGRNERLIQEISLITDPHLKLGSPKSSQSSFHDQESETSSQTEGSSTESSRPSDRSSR